MQVAPSDFIGDTLHLDAAEVGSYWLLICALWNNKGALTDDPRKLARIARCDPRNWPKRWAVLSEFFIIRDGKVTHKRVQDELSKSRSVSTKRSDAANARWRDNPLKNNDAVDANAYASALQENSKSNANHNHNHKKKEKRKDPLPTVEGPNEKASSPSVPVDPPDLGTPTSKKSQPDAAAEREQTEAERTTKQPEYLPADWKPLTAGQAYAIDMLGPMRAREEFEKFRDHWTSLGGARAKKRNWDATWRMWCRRARGDRGRPFPAKDGLDIAMEAINELPDDDPADSGGSGPDDGGFAALPAGSARTH